MFSRRDLRCTEFRLRKTALLDKTDVYHEHRMRSMLPPGLCARLHAAEDRVMPFTYN